MKKATFAGGCFWCMIPPFQNLKGVESAIAGYAGGKKETATYKQVSSGKTKHYEAVQVTYDPKEISYEKLLDVFWKQINPTDEEGQFADKGPRYRTAIFYHDEKQKKLAEESKKKILKKFGTVATKIVKFTTFFPAEEYHQDYHKKNPMRYKMYKMMSGRSGYIKKTWG